MSAVRRSDSSSPPTSPRPEPLKPFDRMFILFASVIGSMLAYKSLRPGFFQKGVSLSILGGGVGYALGINCKCLKKTAESFFNGSGGCSGGGTDATWNRRYGRGEGSGYFGGYGGFRSTTYQSQGNFERRDGEADSPIGGGHGSGSSPSTHGTGNPNQRQRFEEKD